MAKGIKGITVEIGGNTGPLDKALGEVNKKSRSLQVELRQVEKLLKFDPGNTELLAQKQELLGKSINSTEEKLNALKEAQAQVQAQFERGDIGEEQYRQFQRELIKTEQELNNIKCAYQVATRNLEEFGDNNGVAKEEAEKLARAIDEQNRALEEEKEALKRAQKEQKEHEEAVKKATEELEKQKEKIKDAAKIIGAGVLAAGTATATGAGYAIKLSDEFDKAFNTLITKTGASKEEFDSLNTSMENIYKNNLGESIEDVAQSMATVKTNTNLAGEELEKTTERALLLRDTFEFDINESTRSVQMMMKQFGLTSEEAFNLIAQGAQMGLDKNGDLLDTINEYSVHFKQAGYSAEEMFNSLKNGVDAGTFSVDKLGDAVKEFGIRMKDGSADEALKSIGLNVDDVTKRFSQGGEVAADAMGEVVEALFSIKDPLKQNEAGVALFGTMWEDLGADGVNALMNIHGEANRASDTLEEINNKKYDNIGHAIEGLGRTINVDIVKPLGEELQPVVEEAIEYVQDNAPTIKDILSKIADVIGDIVSFIVNNGPTVAGVISGLVTSFMVLKGVLVADKILKFVDSIKTMEGGFKLANVAAALFNGTLLSNPITWVAIAIAGLVSGLIVLWNTNEDFRNNVISIWNSIKDGISQAISSLLTGIYDFVTGVVDFFTSCWNSVSEFTKNAWNTLSNIIQVGIMLIGEIISFGFQIITLPWQFIWQNCKDFLMPLWESIKVFLNTSWENIKSTASTIWNGIKDVISTVWNSIKSTIDSAINTVKNIISTTWNSISSVTNTIFNTISNIIKNIWNGIVAFISPIVTSISNSIKNAWNTIQTTTSSVFNSIKSTIDKIWNGIKNTISSAINRAKDAVSSAIDKIKGFMNFSWSLPKLKLPHVSIKGKFSLDPPEVPKFGIEWYKYGGIMTKPTLFGFNGLNAMVGGEAGPEAILPISNLRKYISEEMNKVMKENSNTSVIENLLRIENFNNNGNGDIEGLIEEIAFYLKRKNIG